MNRQRGGTILTLLVLLFLALLCALLYFLRAPILRQMSASWIVEDSLERADAIIILSDDNYLAQRATRATELFQRGLAPLVVASGRQLRPYAGISELMERDLKSRGVPQNAIVRFPQSSDSTIEEAELLSALAVKRRWKRVIVVTSNYHTRRARYIFRRVFPAGTEVRIAASSSDEFDPAEWWKKRSGQKRFFTEIVGMAESIWELSERKDPPEEKKQAGLARLSPQHLV
ncbi:MAG: YdcF family protein [Acidobacteriia bacterium]|nr:YdcF family protein [Terriglobia bacterium]